MAVNSASGVCDPTIACCVSEYDECLQVAETSQPVNQPTRGAQQAGSGTENSVALAYSGHTIDNVVRTGDGFKALLSGCKEGAIDAVGPELAPPLAFACAGGGMIVGFAKGVISLPGRLWDMGWGLGSGKADETGAALASAPFFLLEFVGYGQMAVSGAAGLKAPVSPPAEAMVSSGLRISGGAGSGVASMTLAGQPAVAIASASGAGGVAAGGVAVAAGGDFGGPMGRPEPVRMYRFKPAEKRIRECSQDQFPELIRGEIQKLGQAGPQWNTVRELANDLLGRIPESGLPRARDAYRSLETILRSRAKGLTVEQVQQLLREYETALASKGPFGHIAGRIKEIKKGAVRPWKPAKTSPPGYGHIEMPSGVPEGVVARVTEYNTIMDKIKSGGGTLAGVSSLRGFVEWFIKERGNITGAERIVATLRELRKSSRRSSGCLRRVWQIERDATYTWIEVMTRNPKPISARAIAAIIDEAL